MCTGQGSSQRSLPERGGSQASFLLPFFADSPQAPFSLSKRSPLLPPFPFKQVREARSEASQSEEAVRRLRTLLAQARSLLRDAGVPFMEDAADDARKAKGGCRPTCTSMFMVVSREVSVSRGRDTLQKGIGRLQAEGQGLLTQA